MPNAEDSARLQALQEGVEAVRSEHEREWGHERLPLLVDDIWRARFNSQKVKWSNAIREAWDSAMLTRDQLEAVETHAGGMKRAYAKLAEIATEAGHRPISPYVFEHALADGSVLAVVQTNDEAAHVIAEGRATHVYTMTELACLIDTLVPESLKLAKVHFPGAKFQASTQHAFDSGWVKSGDEIPFGEVAA